MSGVALIILFLLLHGFSSDVPGAGGFVELIKSLLDLCLCLFSTGVVCHIHVSPSLLTVWGHQTGQVLYEFLRVLIRSHVLSGPEIIG